MRKIYSIVVSNEYLQQRNITPEKLKEVFPGAIEVVKIYDGVKIIFDWRGFGVRKETQETYNSK